MPSLLPVSSVGSIGQRFAGNTAMSRPKQPNSTPHTDAHGRAAIWTFRRVRAGGRER